MTDKRAVECVAQQKAAELWASFSNNQKTAVRFGIMPAAPMQEAIAKGHDSRMLSVALMDLAAKDGGMRS